MPDAKCRCGWDGEGEHPCHGEAYTCRKPATRRMIAYPTALAGMQFKLGAYETFACDPCWELHLERIRLHAMFLQIVRAAGVKEVRGSGSIAYDDDLEAWVLEINNVIHHAYYAEDPGDGGTWVPALGALDTSTPPVSMVTTMQAIKAIYAVAVGDKDPLSAEMIGVLKVGS